MILTSAEGSANLLVAQVLLRLDQHHAQALLGGSGRPPAAVDVTLRRLRDLVVDHVLNIGNVQTPGGDVSGDEDRERVGSEALQTLEPLLLLHVGVQAVRRHLEQAEQVDQSEKIMQKLN